MGKAVFIIPGYKHKPTNKAYKEIARILKKEGYYPVPVTIQWRQTTLTQNTEYFLKKFKKINARKKYILGFSFGAMIAFLASTKVRVSGLILCSLSPYFKEDLPKINYKLITPLKYARYKDFSKLNSEFLAKNLKTQQVHMLYGTKEAKLLKKRVENTYEQIDSSYKYLISVKSVDHNIGDKRYLNKIHQIIKLQLNND